MRTFTLLVPVLFLCIASASAQTNKQMMSIQVLESSSNEQDYNIPSRVVCTTLYGCAARGAETAAVYTIRVKAKIVSSGVAISLICQLRKQGDEKHCRSLSPGIYPAEPKGKDKLILYSWANPLYVGVISKATKGEYQIGAGEP